MFIKIPKGNLPDVLHTSPETRAANALLWASDWYKVVEDMHHCASYCMKDELADLLGDGLQFCELNNFNLKDSERLAWAGIIFDVKNCQMGDGGHSATLQVARYLNQCARKMAELMDEVAR